MYQLKCIVSSRNLTQSLLDVRFVVSTIEETLHRTARLVGGAVRDIYKHVDPHDFDIAVVGDNYSDAEYFQQMCALCDTFRSFGYKTEVHQAYDKSASDFNDRWAGVVKLTSPAGQQYDILLSRDGSLLEILHGFDCTFNQCYLGSFDIGPLKCVAKMRFLHSPRYNHQFQIKPVRPERRLRLQEIADKLGYVLGCTATKMYVEGSDEGTCN